MKSYSKNLVAASTVPIVLSILERGDNYGYQIIKEVQEISGGALNWKEGSLYPVLAKLEKQDLIRSYTKKEAGRNRKYYAINNPGRTFLETAKSEWLSIHQLMQQIWNQPKGLNWNTK